MNFSSFVKLKEFLHMYQSEFRISLPRAMCPGMEDEIYVLHINFINLALSYANGTQSIMSVPF